MEYHQINRTSTLTEDSVYDRYVSAFINDLPKNVMIIWSHAFHKMMNNAIEHSGSEIFHILLCKDCLKTTIVIIDEGIGIFKKIQDFLGLESLDDAIVELFKGKFTTDPASHSGEGIFFTSRALDHFAAISSGKIFKHDRYSYEGIIKNLKSIPSLQDWKNVTGTVIIMSLSNMSSRILADVLNTYSDDEGDFVTTAIPVRNLFDDFPVSRSQARRLCAGLDRFKNVQLDFSGLEDIGQAFADEIFCVYSGKHPNVIITPVNVSENVRRMIHRAVSRLPQ